MRISFEPFWQEESVGGSKCDAAVACDDEGPRCREAFLIDRESVARDDA